MSPYIGAALVTVGEEGRVPVQMANFSDHDVYIQPRTPVGVLKPATVESEQIGADFTHLLSKMDVGALDESQHQQLLSVLAKYNTTFSKDEDDIGYCDMVSHRIVTEGDRPIKIPYRRIPPHHWDEVREYLNKSMERGIIR